MSNCVSRVTVCRSQHLANVTKTYKPKQKKLLAHLLLHLMQWRVITSYSHFKRKHSSWIRPWLKICWS